MRFANSLIFFVLLLGPGVGYTQSSPCSQAYVRAAMNELVRLRPPSEVYGSDGAADGTIVIAGPDHSPHPSIIPVLRCLDVATPVLVDLLDDPRPTRFLLRTGKGNLVLRQASVGHIALDLLIATSGDTPRVHVEPCYDDGLGACVKDGYYFPPDAWKEEGRNFVVEPEVKVVKANWEALLASGQLKLRIPHWMTLSDP